MKSFKLSHLFWFVEIWIKGFNWGPWFLILRTSVVWTFSFSVNLFSNFLCNLKIILIFVISYLPKSCRFLCKFFAHGACLKGEHCEFSHDWKDPPNNVCDANSSLLQSLLIDRYLRFSDSFFLLWQVWSCQIFFSLWQVCTFYQKRKESVLTKSYNFFCFFYPINPWFSHN